MKKSGAQRFMGVLQIKGSATCVFFIGMTDWPMSADQWEVQVRAERERHVNEAHLAHASTGLKQGLIRRISENTCTGRPRVCRTLANIYINILTIPVSFLEASWARCLSAQAHWSRATATTVTIGMLWRVLWRHNVEGGVTGIYSVALGVHQSVT